MRAPPTCTRCRHRPSVYFRPYSGERLCPACFIESIGGRVERAISKFGMFRFDDRIAVGVSGGKDSLNLLHILAEIEGKFPRAELIAVSIDEGVGGYREEALELAGRSCRRLGVEHRTYSFKALFGLTVDEIAARRGRGGLTPCAYCGVLRRRALNHAAREVEADRLATAHNLDDMAQTALLNLMRGDRGRLSSMHPAGRGLFGFVRRVKPFCEVPERESTLLAHLRGLEFQSLPCPYAVEAMRTDIRGFLQRMEAKRPGTLFAIYRTALGLVDLREGETAPRGRCRVCGEPAPGDICRVCQLLGELA